MVKEAFSRKNLRNISYPILILHGGSDMLVSSDDSKNLYENVSSEDKEIKIYEGLYHEILNERTKDEVIEQIHGWIEKRLPD